MPYTPYQRADSAASTVGGGSAGLGTPLLIGDTTLRLPTGQGAKFPAVAPFMLRYGGSELSKCTLRSTDTLTITRGAEGSTAAQWPVGTTVELVETAGSLMNSETAIQHAFAGVYNVRDYGAVGDGVTDDQPAIQAALDACRAAGGGVVYLPAATYLMNTCPAHPNDGTVNVALVIGANTTLRGDGLGVTTIKLGASFPNQGFLLNNYNRLSPGGDSNMVIERLSLNGNAGAMPGTIDAHYGARFDWSRNVFYRHMNAVDFVGTTAGGNGPNGTPGESYMLDAHYSTDVRFESCTCADTGSNKTASGFSSNYCTDVTLQGCVAYKMKKSRGFTHFHCTTIRYNNCHSYLQQTAGLGGEGFNSEVSEEVHYTNCVAGGISSDTTGFPFSANTALGNASHGFLVSNPTGFHEWANCSSQRNGAAGIAFANNGSSLTGSWFEIDGVYAWNGTYGVDADAGYVGTFRLSQMARVANNTTANLRYDGTNTTTSAGVMTAPAIPASAANLQNNLGFTCAVVITGGTVSQVQVAGITVASASGITVFLPPGQNIKLTYTVAPTWSWYALR